jgi:hypothetical protein
VGAIAYLVLGEKRLGQKFAVRSEAIKGRYDSWLQELPPDIRSTLKGWVRKPDLSAAWRKRLSIFQQCPATGSVNLDVRSFWLDFEVTLGVYDQDFAKRLLALQDKYIDNAKPVDPHTWQQRPGKDRFIENLARPASPLL